jgi:hypothetical protein
MLRDLGGAVEIVMLMWMSVREAGDSEILGVIGDDDEECELGTRTDKYFAETEEPKDRVLLGEVLGGGCRIGNR